MPMNCDGRNAVVLGLGLTGFSLARHLAARGARVKVADTRSAPPFADQLRAALPEIPILAGPLTEATLAQALRTIYP
jgi:UDP-N-acetylmuramoylalanine--D-glutamate ligase